MNWVFFSLLTGFCEVAKDVISKKSAVKTNEYLSAFSMQFFSSLTLLPILLITGIPTLKPAFWWSIIIICFGIAAWSIFYMKAVKLSPLSITIPMLAFNPLFVTFFSAFFDKKLPDSFGWLGIIIICLGLYLLRLDLTSIKKFGLLYPIKKLFSDKGALYMLIVAFIWSWGIHVNKINITASSPQMFAFSATLSASLITFIIAFWQKQLSLKIIRSNFTNLSLIGFLNGLSELFLGAALNIGYTPFVTAIKRSNILISVITGKIFFEEGVTKFKLLGIIFIFSGVLLIIAT